MSRKPINRYFLTPYPLPGAGVIGNYSHCSFNTPGKGTFLPGMNTNPFCGQRGAINEEPEIRLEMLVDKARLHDAIAALRRAHPYEEPAFDLVALENLQRNIGLGLVGELKTPMRHNDFLNYVQQQLSIPFLISHGRNTGKISKVAVLGGSGGSYISRIPNNVDALVTGDVGYHDAEAAHLREFTCIDATHYGTEFPVIKVMAARLHKAFPAVKITTFKEKSGAARFLRPKNKQKPIRI